MSEVPSAGGEARVTTTATGSGPGTEQLRDAARLRSLAQAGLGAHADAQMQAIAERVHRWLGVPVALVSLVEPDRQVFPGMTGLPEPWATSRSSPLEYSFCWHVVAAGEPLVVSDAREHPLLLDSPAVDQLGIAAYAGMPLTDEAGNVLGALCVADSAPRRWTDTQLDLLRGLADACSTELRLRLSRFFADVERRHRDELEERMRVSFDRNQELLTASEAFSDTITVEDVRRRVSDLVKTELRPTYVGLALLGDDGRMHRMPDSRLARGAEDTGPWSTYDLLTAVPTATAVRERRIVAYGDRAGFDADHPAPVRRLLRNLDLHAIVAVPLLHVGGPLGALALGWDAPRPLGPADLLTITTLAGYTAQALDRARRLEHRDSAAHQLQQAMLTTLPVLPGLTMHARYQPADSREDVGGDWYDAVPVPDPDHSDGRIVAVSVGDVIGHALDAATVMGQVRSMLRQAAWDHRGEPPSHALRAFELAADGTGLRAMGTALLAHLRHEADRRWTVTWTNAGHPPPILLRPDGGATLLDGHDILFGFPNLTASPRRDHHRELDPGSTLFLYTDGLVERRGSDLDEGTDRLVRLLAANRGLPPSQLVDLAVDTLAPDSPDDRRRLRRPVRGMRTLRCHACVGAGPRLRRVRDSVPLCHLAG
jgi:GAF domain-containing protein